MAGTSSGYAGPNWKRVRELFLEALEQPESERETWLESQSNEDASIRDEVASLLAALRRHGELSREPRPAHRAPSQLEDQQIGERCGPYRLTRLIGTGGMAWVYEGNRVAGEFEQRVAIKVIPAVFGGGMLARFQQEKRILAALNHPGIAHLLDGGTTGSGLSYLVMEYVEGERISSYVVQHGLSRNDRIRIFLKVTEAVEFAHARRVIHRDIKPGNILVDSRGQPKLLDFGIAQLLDAEQTAESTEWRAHTPGYASPEQLRGEPVGVASDVYQLGVLLTEVLTAERKGGDEEALRKSAGRDLAAVIGKARRPSAEDRYASVALFAADLKRCLDGLPPDVDGGGLLARAGKYAKRNRVRFVFAGFVLLVLLAAAAFLYQIHLRTEEQEQRVDAMWFTIVTASTAMESSIAGNQPELASQEWHRLLDSVEQARRQGPDNSSAKAKLVDCYLQLGMVAWFRYDTSLLDADAALLSYERAEHLGAGETGPALTLWTDAHMFASDVLIEKGRGLKAFDDVGQLLTLAEAKRKTETGGRGLASLVTQIASYYDMLSDRLGGNAKWEGLRKEKAPRWYTTLIRLRPWRATDAIAATLYQEGLSRLSAVGIPLFGIRLELGRLQGQAGLQQQGMATLQQSLGEMEKELAARPGTHYLLDHIAGVHLQLGRASDDDGDLAQALREMEKGNDILEQQFRENPRSLYVKGRLGEAQITLARTLARMERKADAVRIGRRGLQLLEENARLDRAPAYSLDIAAQRLLGAPDAEGGNATKALEFARTAVSRTSGEMPPFLVTLAFAEQAAGLHEEAQRTAIEAARVYHQVFAILKPLLRSSGYTDALREVHEIEGELDDIASQQ